MNEASGNRDDPTLDRQLDELDSELRESDMDAETAASQLAKARKVLGLLHRVKKSKTSSAADRQANDHIETAAAEADATPRDSVSLDHPPGLDLQSQWQLDQRRFIGRFEIKRPIGQGGYGLVFQAYDPKLDRDVALKIPRPQVIMTDSGRARFLREAKAAAALAHPNIVPVYESGDDGPVCFIAYEFIDGPTLADLEWPWGDGGETAQRQVARMVAILAEAVHHAHQRGVLHRDLKPSNVMLKHSGGGDSASDTRLEHPLITDFGLAKMIDSEASAAPVTETRTGAIVGTPAYMSPEQTLAGNRQVDERADVYSLGAILYELLTGHAPFQAESVFEALRKVQDEDPVPPHRVDPRIGRDLSAICMKCLEKSPGDRYATAYALQTDLMAFVEGRPVAARPASSWSQFAKWRKRNRALSASLFTAAAAVLIGLAAVTGLWIRADRLRSQAELQGRQLAEQKQLLQTRAEQLTSAIRGLFLEVARSDEIKSPGSAPLRTSILNRAKQFYSEISAAAPIPEERRFDPCETLYELARVHEYLGDPGGALELIREAIAMAQSNPLADADQARQLIKYHVYAASRLQQLGRATDADRAFDEALEIVDRWELDLDEAGGDASWLVDRAMLLTKKADGRIAIKDIDGAAQLTEQALLCFDAIGPATIAHNADAQFHRAICCWIRSRVHRDRGESDLALEFLGQAVDLLTELDDASLSPHSDARLRLAQCLYELGVEHSRRNELTDARLCYAQAMEKLSDLPDTLDLQQIKREETLRIGYSLAVSDLLLGNLAEAEQSLVKSFPVCRELIESYPDDKAKYLDSLADRHNLLYVVRARSGEDRIPDAESAIRSAIELYEQALAERPDSIEFQRELAQALSNLGNVLERQDRLEEASAEYAKSESILQPILDGHPNWARARQGMQDLRIGQMMVAKKQERFEEALSRCREAQSFFGEGDLDFLLLDEAEIHFQLNDYSAARSCLDSFASQARRPDNFINGAQKAMEIAGKIVESSGQVADFKTELRTLAVSILNRGKPAGAEEQKQYFERVANVESLRELLGEFQ